MENKINLEMFGGWDEVNSDGGMKRTNFTKLENGITELRFLDEEPFVRWAHWLQVAKRNVSCIGATCPVCKAIKDAKNNGVKSPYNSNKKFAMHVYNYKTNQVEILEQGKTFFAQLLALHQEIGDIRGYNIKVKCQNAGSTDVLYTLMPCAPTEMPEINPEDLKPFEEIFKLPTEDQILQLMAGVPANEVFAPKSDEDEEVGF